MQQAFLHSKAREVIRSFPEPARRAIGQAILQLQLGVTPGMPLSRPMPAVGTGVYELRVRDAHGIYRAFYVVKSERGILVFHAFEKHTQKTPRHEIELGMKRLKEML